MTSRDEREQLQKLRQHYPGAVTDPAEVARIRARVAHGQLPWWRRLITQTPEGWK